MNPPTTGTLLRVFIGESDRHDRQPLHQWIVNAAREAGLAGATVLRGLEGYGASQRVHQAAILRLSEDLPLVVEIVDEDEKIRAFLPTLDEVADRSFITLEKVEIYRPG